MKRIIYSLLFAAGTLFAGCSDDDTQAPLNTPIQEGNNLYGVVTDPNGAPVGGIVVSDGFSCVATDANGVYQMPRHADAFHVFYRIPADREIPEGFAFTGRANLREITDKPGVEFFFRKGAYVCF